MTDAQVVALKRDSVAASGVSVGYRLTNVPEPNLFVLYRPYTKCRLGTDSVAKQATTNRI